MTDLREKAERAWRDWSGDSEIAMPGDSLYNCFITGFMLAAQSRDARIAKLEARLATAKANYENVNAKSGLLKADVDGCIERLRAVAKALQPSHAALASLVSHDSTRISEHSQPSGFRDTPNVFTG